MDKIIIGTRASELALWQANFVKNELENLFPGYCGRAKTRLDERG
jgi:porphobilinogen deaminase